MTGSQQIHRLRVTVMPPIQASPSLTLTRWCQRRVGIQVSESCEVRRRNSISYCASWIYPPHFLRTPHQASTSRFQQGRVAWLTSWPLSSLRYLRQTWVGARVPASRRTLNSAQVSLIRFSQQMAQTRKSVSICFRATSQPKWQSFSRQRSRVQST